MTTIEKEIEDNERFMFDRLKCRLDSNWLDYKNAMRDLNLLIYMNKLFIKKLDINEEDYPMEWY